MEEIPKHYKKYTDYSNKRQMIPHMIDGLKPVHRRTLVTTFLVAKSFVKTVKVIGEMVARFHPHLESNDGCVWAVRNGFAIGGGAWGSKIGVEPIRAAAPRYTKIKINQDIIDISFKYINSVPWVATEIDPEPLVLPTMIPFCLMCEEEQMGIGTGFKTNIPIYKRNDLFNRLKFLLDKQNVKEPFIKPLINNCDILSPKSDIIKLLTNGTAKLSIRGKFKVSAVNKRVYIHSWNPRSKFPTILGKIDKYKDYGLLSNELISYIDESTNKGTAIRLEVSKLRNTGDIFNKLVEAVEYCLTDTITYNIYIVDEKEDIRIASIDEMLLATYKNYTKVYKHHHTTKIQKIKVIIEECKHIELLKPYLSDSLKLKTEDKIIKFLEQKSGVNESIIINIINKYKIRKLLTVNTDISQYITEVKRIENLLSNLDKSVLNEYTDILA